MIEKQGYHKISQVIAKQMMKEDKGQRIVDVRTIKEYNSGHIPGAICIPNETIGSTRDPRTGEMERPKELPDLDQILLIYCRSGYRSRLAALKLADMGYTRLYDFGGIIEWNGEIE